MRHRFRFEKCCGLLGYGYCGLHTALWLLWSAVLAVLRAMATVVCAYLAMALAQCDALVLSVNETSLLAKLN